MPGSLFVSFPPLFTPFPLFLSPLNSNTPQYMADLSEKHVSIENNKLVLRDYCTLSTSQAYVCIHRSEHQMTGPLGSNWAPGVKHWQAGLKGGECCSRGGLYQFQSVWVIMSFFQILIEVKWQRNLWYFIYIIYIIMAFWMVAIVKIVTKCHTDLLNKKQD